MVIIALLLQPSTAALLHHYRALQEVVVGEGEGVIITDNTLQTLAKLLIVKILLI